MISLDTSRCTKCGRCITLHGGYCIHDNDGLPEFDLLVCNTCQKCVAVCPSQAILVNGTYPDRIVHADPVSPDSLELLLEKRRSTKLFKAKSLSREILDRIVSVARYAPNQNKNIDIHVIDDPELLAQIDRDALAYVRRMYRLLFGFRPLTWFFGLFSRKLPVIKRKMEYDLHRRAGVMKKNCQAVVVLSGDRRVPVTAHSAPYLMANMIIMAETLGIGTCLMHSIYLTIRRSRALRKRLGIRHDPLAAMVLGYSAEHVVNIPRGCEVAVSWNGECRGRNR